MDTQQDIDDCFSPADLEEMLVHWEAHVSLSRTKTGLINAAIEWKNSFKNTDDLIEAIEAYEAAVKTLDTLNGSNKVGSQTD
jgi:hypothetical protein